MADLSDYPTNDQLILANQQLETKIVKLSKELVSQVALNKEQQELFCLIVDDSYCIDEKGLTKDQLYYLRLVQGNLKDLKTALGLKADDEKRDKNKVV